MCEPESERLSIGKSQNCLPASRATPHLPQAYDTRVIMNIEHRYVFSHVISFDTSWLLCCRTIRAHNDDDNTNDDDDGLQWWRWQHRWYENSFNFQRLRYLMNTTSTHFTLMRCRQSTQSETAMASPICRKRTQRWVSDGSNRLPYRRGAYTTPRVATLKMFQPSKQIF